MDRKTIENHTAAKRTEERMIESEQGNPATFRYK